MIWLTGHPGFQRLSRFADGTLRPREQARVASHLADCPRCREEVAMVRRMAETAREIPAPAISDHILRQALNRRAEGERVLLPTADAGAPPARQPKTSRLVAMAAMLTLLVGSLVLSVRVLEADRPALRIHPERPTAGQVLRMEYHGGALFADQTHLKLRARYRTATDRQWQFLAGILVRGDDGLYRAEVALPDSVVYAAFAVEDLEGERLDSNNRQLWDVMVHGDDGRPTLDAMAARVRDLERRDWGEAYEMAREMTRAYPDAPQSWAMRFSFELSLFNRDSVFAEHRTQFRRLEKRLSREAAPAPEEMAWLATYAVGLEDLSSARTWVDRAAESGFGPIVAEAEMLLVSNAFKGDTVGILQDLDSIWDRAPAGSAALANSGLQIARRTGEPEEISVWLERYTEFRPETELWSLAQAVGVAPVLIPSLDSLIYLATENEHSYASLRPLSVPVDDYERRRGDERQQFLASIAATAAQVNQRDVAEKLVQAALDEGWHPHALVSLGEVALAIGDTARAITALSRAASDPLTEQEALTLLRSLPPSAASDWGGRLSAAADELADRTMTEAIVRYLPEQLMLLDRGKVLPSTEVLHGRTTVFAFMSRYNPFLAEEIGGLANLHRSLEELGANLIIVDVDSSPQVSRWLPSTVSIRVLTDPSGEARRAFGSAATPDLFVVDANGRVRFEHSLQTEVLRQVKALDPSGVPATLGARTTTAD